MSPGAAVTRATTSLAACRARLLRRARRGDVWSLRRVANGGIVHPRPAVGRDLSRPRAALVPGLTTAEASVG